MTMDQQNKTYPSKTAQQMQDLTIDWAKRAGFFESTTADIQLEKFIEEHEEVLYAVKGWLGELPIKEASAEDLGAMAVLSLEGIRDHWLEKIKDGVGDSMVTYFIQCELRGLTPTAIKDPNTMGAFVDTQGMTTGGTSEAMSHSIEMVKKGLEEQYENGTIVGLTTSTGYACWIGHMFGFTPEECFDHAYAIINSRVGKGKTVNGVFVKEEDL